MGNKRPLEKSILKPRNNELSEFGRSFHKLLSQIVIDNTPELVFTMLDKFSIGACSLRLHVATKGAHKIGDESYFYIGDDDNRDRKIYKHLKADPSIEAAWQVYLLHYASTIMPVFWNLLLPEVILSPDGYTADVYCTYWNDWKGLMRDHVQITFQHSGGIDLVELEPLCLFEYNCGICF